MNRDTYEMIDRVESYGINNEDAWALRRISMALHRWHELECGTEHGCVERDEETGKTYWCNAYSGRRYRTPDRETGALKRLNTIMAQYPDLAAYVQGDPRGAALYVYRKDSPILANAKYGIESVYSSIGCAIYK